MLVLEITMHDLINELKYYILKYPKHSSTKNGLVTVRYAFKEQVVHGLNEPLNTCRKVMLPRKKEVCPECNGEGTELKGGLKGLAFTGADLNEMDDDFLPNMLNGNFDVACSSCHGQRVIDAPDLTDLPEIKIRELLTYFREFHNDTLECEAERRMEY